VAAGVIPSRDPTESIGHDVNVPFMFWTAVCCVTNSTDDVKAEKNDRYFHHSNDYANLFSNDNYPAPSSSASASSSGKRHLSFAFYARNSGSGGQDQVVAAPVQQLEVLLQDIYKVLPSDANVNLFPAYDAACSELRNDYSGSVRL
jgi:hypothetical protein